MVLPLSRAVARRPRLANSGSQNRTYRRLQLANSMLSDNTHVGYRSVIRAVASGASLKFGVQGASATNWLSRVNGEVDNGIRLYSPETPNLGQIRRFLEAATLKFDGWPWKTIGHLFYASSSFVQHFVPIGEFKLELQSRNPQSGSNSTIFRVVRPWNLPDDLAKQ